MVREVLTVLKGIEKRGFFPHCWCMNRIFLIGFLAVVSIGIHGCNEGAAPVPPAAAPAVPFTPPIPTAAQPKLQTINLFLGTNVMMTEMALKPIEMQTGMMFRTNMAENEGMLFVFPQPYRASFWMKNTILPLSAAYIDSEGVVQEIHDLQPGNTNSVQASTETIQYVLETPQGWFQRHNVGVGTAVSSEYGPLNKIFSFKKQ
jgi:uncharacterized protein